MYKLTEILEDQFSMADKLKKNALNHKRYKMYTSMDRALEFILSGELYLSDGSYWNDTEDSKQIQSQQAYGCCFSYSTKENVAMWMLYGDRCGKNGAMIDVVQSVIRELVSTKTVEVVKMSKMRKAECIDILKCGVDCEVFMTDVLYADYGDEGPVKLTYQSQYCTTGRPVLNTRDVCTKRYEWKYENETRLVVKLTAAAQNRLQKLRIGFSEGEYICLRMKSDSYRRKDAVNIIRSPIYAGKVNYGDESAMNGKIKWELNSNY